MTDPAAPTTPAPRSTALAAAPSELPPPPPPPPPTRDPDEVTAFWSAARAIVRGLGTVMFDFKAYRLDRVPERGGVLLLGNHQSYLDPPLFTMKLRRPAAFLAKSELFDFAPFGWAIRRLNAFPVRQGSGDVAAMKESIRLLQAGWLLTVFPEGSRTPDGRLKPAQKGAGLMVKRAQVPVVPAVVDGAWDAWPPGGSAIPKFKPVRVLYGEPADLSHMKADDIRKWTDDQLATLLDRLRSGRLG